jgi:hypothetical protein
VRSGSVDVVGVAVGVLVTVLVGPTAVLVGVAVTVGSGVTVGTGVPVVVGERVGVELPPGVDVRVGVSVGDVVPLEFPGKPQPAFEAPIAVPCAFRGITMAQISPPFPWRVPLVLVVTATPSVPSV